MRGGTETEAYLRRRRREDFLAVFFLEAFRFLLALRFFILGELRFGIRLVPGAPFKALADCPKLF